MHCLGSKGSTMKQKSLHCACLALCTPKEQKYLYTRSLQRALAAVMVTHMCLRQQSLIAWGWHDGLQLQADLQACWRARRVSMQEHAPAALHHEPGPDSCWAACLRSRGTSTSLLPCTISNGTACCWLRSRCATSGSRGRKAPTCTQPEAAVGNWSAVTCSSCRVALGWNCTA